MGKLCLICVGLDSLSRDYLTCCENSQQNNSCNKYNANDPAELVLARLCAFVLSHVQLLTSAKEIKTFSKNFHDRTRWKNIPNEDRSEVGKGGKICKAIVDELQIRIAKQSKEKHSSEVLSLLPIWLMNQAMERECYAKRKHQRRVRVRIEA